MGAFENKLLIWRKLTTNYLSIIRYFHSLHITSFSLGQKKTFAVSSHMNSLSFLRMNSVNLLKPTGYWRTTSLTLNNCTFCPHCIYVFCIYLRTNSDLCHLQHKLIGFYNRDEKCLLRGTNWVFNHLKPTGYVMQHQFNIQQLYALPTLYLCVLYLSENKQILVPLTA